MADIQTAQLGVYNHERELQKTKTIRQRNGKHQTCRPFHVHSSVTRSRVFLLLVTFRMLNKPYKWQTKFDSCTSDSQPTKFTKPFQIKQLTRALNLSLAVFLCQLAVILFYVWNSFLIYSGNNCVVFSVVMNYRCGEPVPLMEATGSIESPFLRGVPHSFATVSHPDGNHAGKNVTPTF